MSPEIVRQEPTEELRETFRSWLKLLRENSLTWDSSNCYGQEVDLRARVRKYKIKDGAVSVGLAMHIDGKVSSLVLNTQDFEEGICIGSDKGFFPLWMTTCCKALQDGITPNQIVDAAVESGIVTMDDKSSGQYSSILYDKFCEMLANVRYRAH